VDHRTPTAPRPRWWADVTHGPRKMDAAQMLEVRDTAADPARRPS
jgi:hypothetical protein